METVMPAETLAVVIPILAAFVFFAAVVSFVDMTWRPTRK
jgi:hypothetical protein